MASYTDEIMQFNPYVSQIPVEDYVRSGMMQQQNYNQGVQQVQSFISQVAGLPVVGEANVNYLKERMAELRSKISGSVSGDFGKNSLVTQIGSMASQIAKDPNIQNSVQAARKWQAFEAQAAQMRKEKPENFSEANYQRAQEDFQQYIQASAVTPGLVYNGATSMLSGTESQVKKKLLDGIKELDPSAVIDVRQDGNLLITSKNKDLSPEQIKQFAQGLLTAEDMQVLANAGWYNFRGQSDEQVATGVEEYLTSMRDHYKTRYEGEKKVIESTDGLTGEEKAKRLLRINNFKDYVDDYERRINSVKNTVGKDSFNRDAITGTYQVDRMLNGFGAMATHDEELKIEVNPALEAEKTLAEIEKLKADAAKAKKEAEGDTTPPLIDTKEIDPDDPDAQQTNTTKGVTETVQSFDDQTVAAYEGALKSVFQTKGSNGGVITDPDKVDEYGNLLPEAKKEAATAIAHTEANYRGAATSPESGKPIPHWNKEVLNQMNDVAANRNAADLHRQRDEKVTEKAKSMLKAVGINVNPDKKVTIGDETFTIAEVVKMYGRDTEPKELKGVGGTVGGVAPVTTRETKVGTKMNELEKKYGPDVVRDVLAGHGADMKKLNSKKDDIYKELDTVNEPKRIYVKPGDKEQKLPFYRQLQGAVANRIIEGKATNRNIDVSDLKELQKVVGPENIEVKAGYWQNGKLFLETVVTSGTGASQKTYNLDVDVTELRKNYKGGKGDWFAEQFVDDDLPQVTEALRLPNTSKQTAFDPKNGFSNAFRVIASNKVARYMQFKGTESGTVMVRVAIPIGEKDYMYMNFPADESGVPKEFNNVGQAKKWVNEFYSLPEAFQLEKKYIGK
jgi:hypothetical protein